MPIQSSDFAIGPVELALLPHAGGRGEPAARDWLAGRLGEPAAALGLQRDVHGRPHLDRPGHDCNWSHSGPRLLVALARGARVGVDIEVRRPRPKALEIARRYFHPREAEALAALQADAREAAFLRLWCAKEAVLKAHGRGLAYGLDRFEIDGFAGEGRLRMVAAGGPLAADWRVEAIERADAVAVVAWHPIA